MQKTSPVSRPSSCLSVTCPFRACLGGSRLPTGVLTDRASTTREGRWSSPAPPAPPDSPGLSWKRDTQVRSTATCAHTHRYCLRPSMCGMRPTWLPPVLRGCCPLATQFTDGKIEAPACLKPALDLMTCQPGRCCRILSPHSGHRELVGKPDEGEGNSPSPIPAESCGVCLIVTRLLPNIMCRAPVTHPSQQLFSQSSFYILEEMKIRRGESLVWQGALELCPHL